LYDLKLHVGQLEKEDGLYKVHLFDGFDPHCVPYDFRKLYGEGRHDFSDREVRGFIYDRVVPPERQDMNDLLKEMGLENYDEWEVFKACRGSFCTDKFSIDTAPL
jgi:hypothetical protein